MERSEKVKKNSRWNEWTMQGFNNYKVMANLDLATLGTIFLSRIVWLFQLWMKLQ
jgi:hypothetical protein